MMELLQIEPDREHAILPLNDYDKLLVMFSGGKDSIATVLHLLEQGIPRERIELWHHHVDGKSGKSFMDWPVTPSYVEAAAAGLGITLRNQWREGGFEAEMLRQESKTNGVWYENGAGEPVFLPTTGGKESTRMRFPQVSADLSVRWCSAYLKIDVAARALSNDPRLKSGKFLFITGERREESAARSRYKKTEAHRCNNQTRRVDHLRPVIDWSEQEVWDILERWRVQPHPAYRLGFGRLSCMSCIFGGDDQWAAVKALDPHRLNKILRYEDKFGCTIHRTLNVHQRAARGVDFSANEPERLKSLALSDTYPLDGFFLPDGKIWTMPAGAFKKTGGPT